MDPFLTRLLAAALLVAIGVGLAAVAIWWVYLRRRARRDGVLLSVDRREAPGRTFSSAEHRLVGRPDAIRRLSDGRQVPIEIKHRRTPRAGPPRSHRIQVAVYCLLIESTTGRAPPYGLLRYSDGEEFRLPWDDRARDEVLRLRAAIDAPYRGEATPSAARCARCAWHDACDARAPG
ncbi:MAG: Dna2/Cas4 domain-containing protein [Thermoplasmata archaeon]|nr:Dna2/Cas4 domain-containing protein [Thermoplasmata archaeon]MCI4353893.1 Dna2/Cas4 domain-containing protein [Thermoplasmata archaeon]